MASFMFQCPTCCFQSINTDTSTIAVQLHVQGTEIIYFINFNVFPCMKFRFVWDSSHEHVLDMSVDTALTLSTCMAVLLTWNWNWKMPFPLLRISMLGLLSPRVTLGIEIVCSFSRSLGLLPRQGDKGVDFHMRIMLILWQAFGHPFSYTYQHWTLSWVFFSVNLSLSFYFGFLVLLTKEAIKIHKAAILGLGLLLLMLC